jgi:hypothetical protein
LSQEEFGFLLSVDQPVVSAWELGLRRVPYLQKRKMRCMVDALILDCELPAKLVGPCRKHQYMYGFYLILKTLFKKYD